MEEINLTLRLDSDYRFRLPTKLQRTNNDLEAESWYELVITKKVKEPPSEEQADVIEDGALGSVILENS